MPPGAERPAKPWHSASGEWAPTPPARRVAERSSGYLSLATLGSSRPRAPIQRQENDRAPSSERPVLRSPHRIGSDQVLPRHTRGSPYRCSLPGLAGFDDSRCVGPNLQRRPMRLIQHEPPSRGSSTPLKRIAGYRAPLTPHLARPRPSLPRWPGSARRARDGRSTGEGWRRGWDLNPRHRGYPCTAFPVPHLRPLGHPSGPRLTEWENWRRGEDLNPRGTFWAPIRFRVGRLQPGSATPPRIDHRLFVSKNIRSSAALSSASTPPVTAIR